jgi:uncharacterized membrane protein YccC
MKLVDRFVKGDLHGIHYAVSIFIASAVLWYLVRQLADTTPIWAISSMIATSDPLMKQAIATFRGRILNTLVGCATGLLFLALGGDREWTLSLSLAVTVLLSSYIVRIPTMWRQAPITAAIVIAGELQHHSRLTGMEAGIRRVGEVLLGCVVGLIVAWLLSKVWPIPEIPTPPTAAAPTT